jgi:glutamate synthase (NADPH/NADH) small chain
MGPPDEKGRQRPEQIAGSEHTLEADAVIMAFGFKPSPCGWLQEHGVDLDQRGLVIAPESGRYPFQTSRENIFAGGDAVRGSDLVVTAIAEGRYAGEAILDYLEV